MKKRDFLKRIIGIIPAIVIAREIPLTEEPPKNVEQDIKPTSNIATGNHCTGFFSFGNWEDEKA